MGVQMRATIRSSKFQNTTAENCFTLWLLGVLAFLSGIPLISTIVCNLLNKPIWSVPKTYELKIYACCMLMCIGLSSLFKYKPNLLTKSYDLYRLYILLFYPSAACLYAIGHSEQLHYWSIFILSLGGLSLFIYETYYHSISLFYVRQHYYQLLALSCLSASIVVLTHSVGNVFHLFSWWTFCVFIFGILFINFKKKIVNI